MSGETGLRERKKQRMYRTISEAAIGLFLEHGFDRVSVADVAAAAEISKPTLFRYFAAKEDLVLHRFADHQDEAGRVVRERRAGESPLDALRRHFAEGLDRRDPVTGLNDHPSVLAFHRLVYGTPSLAARLLEYTDRSEEALAEALREAAPPQSPDDITARLAAGQIIACQRILAQENWRRIEAGAPVGEVLPGARAAADRAFAMLRSGLGPYG